MTAAAAPRVLAEDLTEPEPPKKPALSPELRWAMFAVTGVAILSMTRVISGAADLTSSGLVTETLRLSVPFALAAMGGLFSERAGVVNIGLEGIMILGTWFGAYGGWQWGVWGGLAFGILGGALGGALHATATVIFKVDHIISGVAINLLAPGLARYLSAAVYADVGQGAGVRQSPPVKGDFPTITITPLSKALGSIEDHQWFFVSDLAGIGRGLVTGLSLFTLGALVLVPLVWWLLWRTRFGLRLRSVGEHPWSAESVGVKVLRTKFMAVTISGVLAGMAGVFIVTVTSSTYSEGQTGGRGYIALAALIFGNWRPVTAAGAALLFGYSDAVRLRGSSGVAVHAFLLAGAIATALVAAVAAYQRRWRSAAISATVSLVLLVWYLTTDTLPREFLPYTPHIVTLVVAATALRRLRMPAALGIPFRKGEAI
ncbi:MAG: ABC transporter permease [Microthrixaceae bacterium]